MKFWWWINVIDGGGCPGYCTGLFIPIGSVIYFIIFSP